MTATVKSDHKFLLKNLLKELKELDTYDDPVTERNLFAKLETGVLYTQDDFYDYYCIDRKVQEIKVIG